MVVVSITGHASNFSIPELQKMTYWQQSFRSLGPHQWDLSPNASLQIPVCLIKFSNSGVRVWVGPKPNCLKGGKHALQGKEGGVGWIRLG